MSEHEKKDLGEELSSEQLEQVSGGSENNGTGDREPKFRRMLIGYDSDGKPIYVTVLEP